MSSKEKDDVQMDTYDRVAITSDSGYIGKDYQWEETVDVSGDDSDDDDSDDDDSDDDSDDD